MYISIAFTEDDTEEEDTIYMIQSYQSPTIILLVFIAMLFIRSQ